MPMTEDQYHALGLLPPPARVDPPAGPADVASLLDRPLRECPDALALADPAARYTYAELDAAIARWAGALAAHGVTQGRPLAVSLPNGCDIVIAFMAAARLGAIWVGVNMALPSKEKGFIIGHSGAALYLSDAADQEAMAPALAELDCPGIAVESPGWQQALAAGGPVPQATIDPFAPATIMYTSGTTGQPKGVVHTQHNLVTVCAALTEAGTIKPQARRGVVQPLTIANVMTLGALLCFWNARPLITRPMPDIVTLVDWFHDEGIESCIIAPTSVYDILEKGLNLPAGLEIASGGAPIPSPIRRRFLARFGYPILGTYGLTEAPTIVTDTRGEEPPVGSSGKVLPHMRLAILDSEGRELPAGEVGDLCFGPVAEGTWANVYTPPLGYWHDREKTAELLAGGLVHSGDVGSVDTDGWLFVADRASELILRGGNNIYPAEVERVLQEHSGIVASALVGQPDERLGKRTVIFVHPREADADQDRLKAELMELCREGLARYKMPDEWRFVGGFERNAMGKIVRPKLLALLLAEAEAQ